MNGRLSELFAYPSRTEILETLFYQPGELGLRQIAAVADVHVRSAELALADLQRARLVSRRRRGNRVMFALDRRHLAYPLIRDVFMAAETRRIKDRAESDRNVGREILSFVTAALSMAQRARRSVHANR